MPILWLMLAPWIPFMVMAPGLSELVVPMAVGIRPKSAEPKDPATSAASAPGQGNWWAWHERL